MIHGTRPSAPKAETAPGRRAPEARLRTAQEGTTSMISRIWRGVVRDLKGTGSGDVFAFGGARLGRTLMDHELVDEHGLWAVVLRASKRLFEPGGRPLAKPRRHRHGPPRLHGVTRCRRWAGRG